MNQIAAGKIGWRWSSHRDRWEHDRVGWLRSAFGEMYSPLTHDVICQCGQVMKISIGHFGHGKGGAAYSSECGRGGIYDTLPDIADSYTVVGIAECDCDDPCPVKALPRKLNMSLYTAYNDLKDHEPESDEEITKRLEWKYFIDMERIEKRDHQKWLDENGGPTPGGLGAIFG